jgi:hypothetical protein
MGDYKFIAHITLSNDIKVSHIIQKAYINSQAIAYNAFDMELFTIYVSYHRNMK